MTDIPSLMTIVLKVPKVALNFKAVVMHACTCVCPVSVIHGRAGIPRRCATALPNPVEIICGILCETAHVWILKVALDDRWHCTGTWCDDD